jgi:hypothetical protein
LLHSSLAFTDHYHPFFPNQRSRSEAILPILPDASSDLFITPSDAAAILLDMRQRAPNSRAAGTRWNEANSNARSETCTHHDSKTSYPQYQPTSEGGQESI